MAGFILNALLAPAGASPEAEKPAHSRRIRDLGTAEVVDTKPEGTQ